MLKRLALLGSLLVLAFASLGAAAASAACDNSWENGSGGDWDIAMNWSMNVVPDATQNVCIVRDGTYSVVIGHGGAPAESVKSLTIGGDNGTQTLAINGATSAPTKLTAVNGVTNGAHGAIAFTGNSPQLLGNLDSVGGIQVGAKSALFGAGAGTGPATLLNRGTISIPNGGSLSTDQTITNFAGSIDSSGSGALKTTGTFNQGAGKVTGNPVRFTAGGGNLNFVGRGASAFQLENGATNVTGNVGAAQSVLVKGATGQADPALQASALVNGGTIGLAGDAGTSPRLRGSVVNSGALNVSTPGARFESGTLLNQGAVSIADGAALGTDQTIINSAGGHVDAAGAGGLQTTGTFDQGAGTTTGSPVRFVAGGNLAFIGGGPSAFQLENGVTNVSGNPVAGQSIAIHAINGLADPVLRAAGGLTNSGVVTADSAGGGQPRVDGNFVNAATVAAAAPLAINGAFTQTAGGTTNLNVNALGYSSVNASGPLLLGGALRVTIAPNSVGVPIRRIVTGSSVDGAFASKVYSGPLYALLYENKYAYLSPTAVPSIGRTIGTGRIAKSVKVRAKGAKTFKSLPVASGLATGSEVDATGGTASVTTAVGATGAATGNVQSAAFRGGRFTVAQGRSTPATVTLSGPLSCAKSSRASAAAIKSSKRTRRLFGAGKGRFTTKGRFGAATIRGTSWEVQDFCDRTVFTSVHGTVSIRDTVKRKTVTLQTGDSYTARAR